MLKSRRAWHLVHEAEVGGNLQLLAGCALLRLALRLPHRRATAAQLRSMDQQHYHRDATAGVEPADV